MSLKKFVKNASIFSKRDAIGAIILVSIVSALLLITNIFKKSPDSVPITEDTLIAAVVDTLVNRKSFKDEFENESANNFQYDKTEDIQFREGQLFEFDPNTIDLAGWQKLGLPAKTIKTINNYRTKGGKFYKKEDLKKIWGMPPGFYERVEDYINITSIQQKTFDNPTYASTYKREERRINNVNINQSDTSAFIALPGIGSKLAARIVNFRDRIGGFHSVEQIKETYGLPDSTFQKIKPYLQVDAEQVKKFNLNTATKDELKLHPYIKWNLANVIVEYRNQHGAYKSINDLKKIALIDDATFNKIAPYFTL